MTLLKRHRHKPSHPHHQLLHESNTAVRTQASTTTSNTSFTTLHLLIVTVAALAMWFGGSSFMARMTTHDSSTTRTTGTPSNQKHGWNLLDVQGVDSAECNIPRIHIRNVTRNEFQSRFLEKSPVILVGTPNADNVFAQRMTRANLLQRYGNHSITLSSANRNSYKKIEVPLVEYLDASGPYMRPQPLDADGASTWYHFGDNKHDQWDDVFRLYERPTDFTFGPYSSLSFGIGPAGSGVPFHTHGHVFNEVIYGKKRWWLQAPTKDMDEEEDTEPRFEPDASSLQWLHDVYPTLHPREHAALWHCVCAPGETLYIPSLWHHSTLNIGETVFMAVFV